MIELHKEGKEIKEIPQILNNANIKISYGSVWNIVEASCSQSKATEPSNQVDQSSSSVLNSTIPDDLMRDHSSISSSALNPDLRDVHYQGLFRKKRFQKLMIQI